MAIAQGSVALHAAGEEVVPFQTKATQEPIRVFAKNLMNELLCQAEIRPADTIYTLKRAIMDTCGVPPMHLIFNGTELQNLQTVEQAGIADSSTLLVVVLKMSRVVTAGAVDRCTKVWDMSSSQCLFTLEGDSGSLPFVPCAGDGRILASVGTFDGCARVWDLETGKCLRTLTGAKKGRKVSVCCFSPGGEFAVTAAAKDGYAPAFGTTEEVILWEVETGRRLIDLQGHSGDLSWVCFSHDSRFVLASGNGDGSVPVWHLPSGEFFCKLEGHGAVHCAFYSPDSKYVVVAGDLDKAAVKIYEAATGRYLRSLGGHVGIPGPAAFSPNSRMIATTHDLDGQVRIWNVDTGQMAACWHAHMCMVRCATFSRDGRKLLTAGAFDGEVKIWEVQSGKCVCTLEAHKGGISFAELAPDGEGLLTVGYADNLVKIWELGSSRCIGTLAGHSGGAKSASWVMPC
eukprot:gnl/TRDRNA2_/TRDRNA2_195177_c0_seq1.p1 gnl/TRDRNA2_/TRDRNA2_195177_c0~~gnl/TRDRNA2_/TRDRNA2_195177_c0_seq1.p1  ORF type:complete len:470 (+),score=68.09 gnl/TRDRNA2_/TRDRNA2_195177_c0_seq1:41-1411(+)